MTTLNPFKLERYFGRYEFNVKYLLSPSDCEGLTLAEMLQLADPDSLRLWEHLQFAYTESSGHPILREEIAGLYQTVPADGIVVAVPEEAIYVALNTLLRPGDHVVCLTPVYQSLFEVGRALRCTVTPWEIEAVGNRWRLPLDKLESLITERTRLLIVNFPHNPTGYHPTRAEFDSIVDIARRHNLYLFCDEMYRLLEHDPARLLPAIADVYERGISLSGLSKTFALPGLRVGWLATQAKHLPEEWVTFKDYTTICNSAPSEILAIMALRAKEVIIERNLNIVRSNIVAAQDFCARHPALVTWLPPLAGSIAFPGWLGQLPVDEFAERIVNERGVMIVPASMFDYGGQHFRVGLGRKNLPEVLGVVSEFLNGGMNSSDETIIARWL